MARRIMTVSNANLKDIPEPCRSCSYWESSFSDKKTSSGSLKKEWFAAVSRNFGDCGKLIYVNGRPVAYSQYAPPFYFSKIKNYTAAPLSGDAIFLSCLFVAPAYRGKGYGKDILIEIVKSLSKKGFKALETFGNKGSKGKPSASYEFYLKNGFYVIRDNEKFPLMRLDFKSVVSWQEGFEVLLEGIKIPFPKKEAPVPY
ncbi:GNAT family N-acetyltransferase [Candidatus Oleimmundimicrobium sp.]|uniref:GNAT family N-acetyltransferase n=1 Tax=Candidatus Oleimmundimicrobium sp. TaxID=3060597 RepID=UPI002727F06D|nr:GNAT family N-acetyltransferase [Candidatus Oleimmundimicrobium sp.]MDO8886850.1 GNAT family N-acetyltransferase [Candidatus Oleimmundimicrobium sp.]